MTSKRANPSKSKFGNLNLKQYVLYRTRVRENKKRNLATSEQILGFWAKHYMHLMKLRFGINISLIEMNLKIKVRTSFKIVMDY